MYKIYIQVVYSSYRDVNFIWEAGSGCTVCAKMKAKVTTVNSGCTSGLSAAVARQSPCMHIRVYIHVYEYNVYACMYMRT